MLLLTFTAGSSRYAVAVSRIVEVLPKLEVQPIHNAPPVLAGLLSYRGKVIPVIDLGLLLSTAPCQNLLSSRMILVNDALGNRNQANLTSAQPEEHSPAAQSQSPALLGLVAENVNDLIYVQPEQLSPVPVQVPNAPYLDAIVKMDREIIPLIAVEKVRNYLVCGALSNQSAVLNPPINHPESVDPYHEDRACTT